MKEKQKEERLRERLQSRFDSIFYEGSIMENSKRPRTEVEIALDRLMETKISPNEMIECRIIIDKYILSLTTALEKARERIVNLPSYWKCSEGEIHIDRKRVIEILNSLLPEQEGKQTTKGTKP